MFIRALGTIFTIYVLPWWISQWIFIQLSIIKIRQKSCIIIYNDNDNKFNIRMCIFNKFLNVFDRIFFCRVLLVWILDEYLYIYWINFSNQISINFYKYINYDMGWHTNIFTSTFLDSYMEIYFYCLCWYFLCYTTIGI